MRSTANGSAVGAHGLVMSVRGMESFTICIALVLGLGVTTFGAPRAGGARSDTPVIRAKNQSAIVGPEGAPFNMPSDAAVSRDGNLYVLDGVNSRVVVCDGEGRLRFQFGNRGSGLGQFAYPLGMATDPEGNIYVADSGNRRFQIFAAGGRPVEAVPLPATKSGAPPDPTDLTVDSTRQRLYIADNDNHVIHVYNLAERRFESVWGGPGRDQRQFRFPFLVDTSAPGYLFVVESINTRVQVLNPEGKFVTFIGGWGIQPGQLFRPKGVTICNDRVYVTDSYLGYVQIFALDGTFLGVLADAAGTPLSFITPTGITSDAPRQRLYVVELKANRVCRVDLE